MDDISDQARALFDYTRALRRDFHRNPELGFKEYRTAGIVARELNNFGLEVSTGIGKTGVVGVLEGEKPGPILLLRFDMDALPIQEQTNVEYSSQIPGVMHACGHDGHTAIGLTVARLLSARRHSLSGTVKFVFQPAEEGLGGAESMIADGVLENPIPDLLLSLHLWNNMPLGWLGITTGPVMAASDIFNVTVHGQGGHGAIPNLAVDPVLASAYFITAIQSIVARNVNPLESAVISVTSIHGGEAHNIIPAIVQLTGTIRTFQPDVRTLVIEKFQRIAELTAQALSCTAEVNIQALTPAVINSPEITHRVLKTAARLFPNAEIDQQFITMGSEDFAYFMKEIPGCYFFIGSADPADHKDAPHHHPRFDFDEQALWRSGVLMTSVVLDLLSNPH
jgi:amidohydrolase